MICERFPLSDACRQSSPVGEIEDGDWVPPTDPKTLGH